MYVTPPQLIDCETTFGILESIFTKSKKTATDISSWEFRDRDDYSDKAVRLIPARPSSCCNRLQSDNDRLIIRCVGSAIIFVIDRFLFMAMDGLSPACVGSFGDVMAGFCLRMFLLPWN
ncbi:unnamed protein product [Arabidopsis thaliana]|uniref:Uncharacterized protein n=2 Tax=Arabidopsis thaliana TaxID=3702 RepID=A0A654GCY8_ARATH|nr:uncharacterized protein AT5G60260 [Arabidopsis thaliana]AED97300.2 hypothetical protein AT5G60260 [Arabidopsis thaliana]VYS70951.1 unnamed protein product [Arabidopsis thaliana]|eukprot:NP_001318846.1 hypothetical protein AT5G60260 [Arabidopsis thaliana]